MESYGTLTCHGPCKYQEPLDRWGKEVRNCPDCKAVRESWKDSMSFLNQKFCRKHIDSEPKQYCDCHTSTDTGLGPMPELEEPLYCFTYSRDFNFK